MLLNETGMEKDETLKQAWRRVEKMQKRGAAGPAGLRIMNVIRNKIL